MDRFINHTKASINRALESAKQCDDAALSLESQAADCRAQAEYHRAAAAEAQFVLDNLSKISAPVPLL